MCYRDPVVLLSRQMLLWMTSAEDSARRAKSSVSRWKRSSVQRAFGFTIWKRSNAANWIVSRPRCRRAAFCGTTPSVLRWLSADMLVAALVTIVVIAVLIWGGGRVMAAMRQSSENSQTASGFLIPSQTPSPNPTSQPTFVSELVSPSPTQAGPVFTPPALTILGPAGQVDLHLVVEKRSYLRVVVDGAEAFSGRVAPGQAMPDYVGQVVEVWTGNGGGLRAVYNGQDQGLLGELGEVVIRLWTTQGVLTPTPTQTPTPTETPKVSPTPEISSTPRPIRLPTTTPEAGT
jgi:hypothetical protein